MADVRWGCSIAAEQALSGHLDIVPSLYGLKQKWLPNGRRFCNTTTRSWFHNLAIRIATQLHVSGKY